MPIPLQACLDLAQDGGKDRKGPAGNVDRRSVIPDL